MVFSLGCNLHEMVIRILDSSTNEFTLSNVMVSIPLDKSPFGMGDLIPKSYKWSNKSVSSYTMFLFKKMLDRGEVGLEDVRDFLISRIIK